MSTTPSVVRNLVPRGPRPPLFPLYSAFVGLSFALCTSACGRNDFIDANTDGGSEVSTFDGTETDTETDTVTTETDTVTTETDTETGPEPECGNGILELDEECDPGEPFIGPNEFCLPGCIEATCGDGFLWFDGEQCDDGNDNDNDACTSDCVSATCGDGLVWQGFEECDDANNLVDDACINCQAATCGDGWLWSGVEQCDDSNDQSTDACVDCVLATCGDGFVWEGVEECDQGPFGNQPASDCTPECLDHRCGDGYLHWNEECDPGDDMIGPDMACLPGCIINTNTCGDGVLGPGETCDDGNDDNTDDCLDNCQAASCGDGFVWAGNEGCDDGAFNGPNADCTPECQPNVCGDGYQHPSEECDPGAANIGPGQACLDGCILNTCGDGDQSPSEECDDGNTVNTDACTNACTNATCGDGVTWEGVEGCDDANLNDVDACHNDCSETQIKVALGGNHTCVLYDFGSFRCWGNGDDGRTAQSSEDDIGDDELAIAGVLANFGSDAVDIYTGISHTCVQMSGGQLICFGRGDNGQIGYATTEDIGDNEPPNALGPLPFPVAISHANARGGSFHNCATTTAGATYCWGRHDGSVLGVPGLAQDIGDNEGPTGGGIVNIGGIPDELSMGYAHSCARIGSAVRCWGSGAMGALGYGNGDTIGDDETPATAGDVPVGANVTQISAGFYHTCALTEAGGVRCWGRGNNGRLGYGSQSWLGLTPSTTPAVIGDVDLGGVAIQVAAGNAHTCALLDDGSVKCWGWGGRGQLGYGNMNDIGDDELPSSVGPVPLPGPATQIAADGNHSCAVIGGNTLYCWGDGGDGRLGYGSLNNIGDDETPTSVGPIQLF